MKKSIILIFAIALSANKCVPSNYVADIGIVECKSWRSDRTFRYDASAKTTVKKFGVPTGTGMEFVDLNSGETIFLDVQSDTDFKCKII